MGAVALLLLIACVNVAGMTLARAAAQEPEVATRYALGASRARVVRLRLFESLLLATMAGGIGAGVSWIAGPLMPALLSRLGEVPGGQAPSRLGVVAVDLTPDARVLVFVVGAIWLCGIAIGVAPALRATRVDLLAAIRRCTPRERCTRWRAGTIVVLTQVALSMTLVVMTGLLSRTVANLDAVPLGFEPSLLSAGGGLIRDLTREDLELLLS